MNSLNYVPKRIAEGFSLLFPNLIPDIYWDINEELTTEKWDTTRLQDEDEFEMNTPTWCFLTLLPELGKIGYVIEIMSHPKTVFWCELTKYEQIEDRFQITEKCLTQSYDDPRLALNEVFNHIIKKEL